MARLFDVVILGAGAAGMMAAIRAGQRGRTVLVLDHARAPGEKIRISGGGRCNFTNTRTTADHFYSRNPHFAKSALARFTPQDFIALVQRHNISFHEKTLGQLFCDNSAKDIVQMLVREMLDAGVTLELSTEIGTVEKSPDRFEIATSNGPVKASSLIVATGGKSIPKMGATGFAYRIAEQFGMDVVETRPGLVPLTLDPLMLETVSPLAGIAVQAAARVAKTQFKGGLLFTHRGLSGPAILQISSVWREGQAIELSFEPDVPLAETLKKAKRDNGKQALATALSATYPKRLAQYFAQDAGFSGPLAELPDRKIEDLEQHLRNWPVKPAGSEGYRTAEVTMGGVDTAGLDSRTMEAKHVPGLFFIGECVDVTGWLGGYNFQWAWSSGHAAGSHA
ncbi:MAG: hypothetical protein RIR97_497 [Pseudomonadota bacterium]